MAFKDTGRWQEQLCDTSNHRIYGGSSSGLIILLSIVLGKLEIIYTLVN